MSFTLNPSKTFRAVHAELAVEHAAAVRTNKFHVVIDFAMAKLATNPKITSENLTGAREFVEEYLNIAERPEEPKPLAPDKPLGQPAKK